MGWFFIVQYHSGGSLKIILDLSTGLVKKFDTKRKAKKFAEQNCLGIYQIYKFGK